MFPTMMNSLSVGVFSCERLAAQFPPLWRKILLRRGQRKVRLSEGRSILVTFSPFSSTSRGNKHIFRAYPSTLKIAKLCFETTAAHSTIIWSARLGFLLLREAGTDGTGFVGVLPLPSTHVWSSRKHHIVHGNNAQDCFRYSLAKSITGCIKFTKRTELWLDFWQLDDIFEPPGQNELIIWKTDSRFFFSLASPALRIRACEAQALALTLLWPYSKPILQKKTTVLQSTWKQVTWTCHVITWDQALFCFFASLLLWLEREKNNAWYIHLTSRQPPPSLHNLTSAWPVMLLANNRLPYRSQIFARIMSLLKSILGKRKFLSTSMLRWLFDSPPKFKCVVFVMKYC